MKKYDTTDYLYIEDINIMDNITIFTIILTISFYPLFIDGVKRIVTDLALGTTYAVAYIIKAWRYFKKFFY